MDFENFYAKNFIFSIFVKLSKMLFNDAKTNPMCFVTLKPNPKASEHIMGSFEKKFSHRIFDLRKPFFAYGADQFFENGILRGFSKPQGFFQMKAMA